jgi:hypothetical protein
MVEILVRTKDEYNDLPDLTKYQKGRYFKGDVIVIMPDGHTWSDSERNANNTRIIIMKGVPFDDVKDLQEPLFDKDPELPDAKRKAIRRYKIDLDNFTKTIEDSLKGTTLTNSEKVDELIKLREDKATYGK